MKNKSKIITSRSIPRTLRELFMITKLKLNHTNEEALKSLLQQQKENILPPNWHLNTQKIKASLFKKDLEEGKENSYIQIKISDEYLIKNVEKCINKNYTTSKYFLEYFIVWYAKEYIKKIANTDIYDI